MQTESTRQSKVGKQIQKDLSEIMLGVAKANFSGKMLTVTVVRVTPDLGLAKAYVSVFPSEGAESVIKELNVQVKSIRNELGRRIRHQLKKVPELMFYLDDSLDYADRINSLLKDK